LYRTDVRTRQNKHSYSPVKLGLLFGITLAAVAAVYFIFVVPKPKPAPLVLVTDHKAESATQSVPATTYRGLPMRLQIPAISVDSSIDYLGNTSTGAMASPASPNTTGWYKYGAIPGETGSAVMAGHVVGPKGEQGVFYNLSKLKPGDILQVVDAKGRVASFAVREIRTYDEEQQHTEIFNSTNGTHLNLITCAGDWSVARHKYLQRLVVFADKKI
jgi:LPXTG-site transpeptidase (sortase) family protein